jgi:hypothetical protein
MAAASADARDCGKKRAQIEHVYFRMASWQERVCAGDGSEAWGDGGACDSWLRRAVATSRQRAGLVWMKNGQWHAYRALRS